MTARTPTGQPAGRVLNPVLASSEGRTSKARTSLPPRPRRIRKEAPKARWKANEDQVPCRMGSPRKQHATAGGNIDCTRWTRLMAQSLEVGLISRQRSQEAKNSARSSKPRENAKIFGSTRNRVTARRQDSPRGTGRTAGSEGNASKGARAIEEGEGRNPQG